jgi:hypothetical protein
MAEPDPSRVVDAPQNLLAELRALRDQVQSQHGLITALTGRLGNDRGAAKTSIKELKEPLPTHPSRLIEGEPRPAPRGDFASAARKPGPVGKPWWPGSPPTREALHPVPGWALYGQQGVVKTIGFSVLGLDEAATRRAVDFVARAQRNQRNFVPVFLTDLDELQVFRDQGFVAEYVSVAGIEPAGRQRYLENRRSLIQRKWNLGSILDMTRAAQPDLSTADFAASADPTAVADAAAPPVDADGEEETGGPMTVAGSP